MLPVRAPTSNSYVMKPLDGHHNTYLHCFVVVGIIFGFTIIITIIIIIITIIIIIIIIIIKKKARLTSRREEHIENFKGFQHPLRLFWRQEIRLNLITSGGHGPF